MTTTRTHDGKPSVEERLRFREVAFGTTLLAFSAISMVVAVAILGAATATEDLLNKWRLR